MADLMTTVSNEIPDFGNMFHPSPPALLPFTESFILRYVTASSSALSFTTTTASSAGRPPARNGHISAPFRRRCRSYNAPEQAAFGGAYFPAYSQWHPY